MLNFFLQIFIVLFGLNAINNLPRHNCLFFHPKLSHLVLLVIPNTCYTPMQRYLWFVQWPRICNEKKEQDFICLSTNENAQLHSAGGMSQLAPTDWAQSK